MTFPDVLTFCAGNADFVREFNRLQGAALPVPGERKAPLDQMIDDATGRTNADVVAFIAFVHEVVWSRLPVEVRAA